jgi:hypothetical protein
VFVTGRSTSCRVRGAVALLLTGAADGLVATGGLVDTDGRVDNEGRELVADDRLVFEDGALVVGRAEPVVVGLPAGAVDTATVRSGCPVTGWCAWARWAVQPAASSSAAVTVRAVVVGMDGHPFRIGDECA